MNEDYFYIEATNYYKPRSNIISKNILDERHLAECRITRSGFLGDQKNFLMNVSRFNVDTSNIPCYIQKKVRDNNLEMDNTITSNTNTILDANSTNFYFILEFGGTTQRGGFISWIPYNNALSPPSLPIVNEIDIFKNPYYWAMTDLHIMKLISNTMTAVAQLQVPTTKGFEIIKTNTGYALYIDKALYDAGLKIYFNYELIKILPFLNYQVLNTNTNCYMYHLQFDDDILPTSTLPNGNIYYYTLSLYKSSSIFPFTNLQILSNAVGVRRMARSINETSQGTDYDYLVLDYTIQSDDPMKIYDFVQYTANIERWVNCYECNLSNVSFVFMLASKEGYTIPVYLLPETYAQILLQFKKN